MFIKFRHISVCSVNIFSQHAWWKISRANVIKRHNISTDTSRPLQCSILRILHSVIRTGKIFISEQTTFSSSSVTPTVHATSGAGLVILTRMRNKRTTHASNKYLLHIFTCTSALMNQKRMSVSLFSHRHTKQI